MSTNNTHICLVALIGLPAAGKTNFCQWLLQLQRHNFKVIHIHYDDYLPYMKHNSHANFNYQQQRIEIVDKIDNQIQQLQCLQNSNKNKFVILCDDNNYYRSMRHDLYKLCRKQQIAYAQIYFTCCVDIANSRNAHRSGNAIPTQLLLRMAERLEAPLAEKYFFERNTLQLDTSENIAYNTQFIIDFLENSFQNIPLRTDKTATVPQKQCMVNKLDLLLRAKITQVVQLETNSTNKSNRADKLNEQRKQLLQQFKSAYAMKKPNSLPNDESVNTNSLDFWLSQLK